MENNKPVLSDSIINLNALSNGLNTMAFTVPTLYLNMFMTDYLGISPVAMGTGMLIAKTFDFIISLVVGVIIEKANMKHGKYLSWLRLLTVTVFFGNIKICNSIANHLGMPDFIQANVLQSTHGESLGVLHHTQPPTHVPEFGQRVLHSIGRSFLVVQHPLRHNTQSGLQRNYLLYEFLGSDKAD